MQVKDLVENIIHLRGLLRISRQKSLLFARRIEKLEYNLQLTTVPKEEKGVVQDHPLVKEIAAIELDLYRYSGDMDESIFRQKMAKMRELTDQLLSFRRDVNPVLN